MTYRKKLIEVALPLNAINEAAITEKSIRHGHPSTLHLWWARRPLATCRAVLFASLIDDPSEHPEEFPTEEAQEQERERLFAIIRRFVEWKNSNNEHVLAEVRREIQKATGGNPPPVLDPFAGGGSIPLEAQRMGLEAHASDLNPVAVLINKALIEIPPKFANCPPVNPEAQRSLMGRDWHGAQGLADDIRYYGKWMRDEAQKRIGHLYPKATLSKEYGGGEATVIAWLWVRTVTCPNPVCGTQMPLVRSFYLSKKKSKETYVEPHVDYTVKPPVISFTTKIGQGKPQDGTVNRQGATCLVCHIAVPFDYVRSEGRAGRMKAQLMALVAEGNSGRAYLAPDEKQVTISESAKPEWKPEAMLPNNTRDIRPQIYGLPLYGDLFTPRQLVALTTFSKLVQETKEQVLADAHTNSIPEDALSLENGGTGTVAYSDVIATYLAIALDKGVDYWSSICSWHSGRDTIRNTFARQAIPMVWDFAEANPMSESTGNFSGAVNWIAEVVALSSCDIPGKAEQRDAMTSANSVMHPLIWFMHTFDDVVVIY